MNKPTTADRSNHIKRIQAIFTESAKAKERFAAEQADRLAAVAERCAEALEQGKKLLLFGNGGSACDASHIAAEFVNRFSGDRPRHALAALALTTDMANITSISNDSDYSQSFARQVEALGQPGDVVIAISTSGNSPNVLKAVEQAKAKGLYTVGLTGGTGGKLAGLVDAVLVAPSKHTSRIQEVHITIGHTICELVENRLFGFQ